MSSTSKAQLQSDNNSKFPNNNTNFITPDKLRSFNSDMIDSTVNQGEYTLNSSSFDTRIDALENATSSYQTGSYLSSSLQEGYVWAGGVGDVAVQVATSSFGGGGITGDFVTTASFNSYTSSNDGRVQALETETGSLQTQIDSIVDTTGSFATTSSLNSLSSSIEGRLTTD